MKIWGKVPDGSKLEVSVDVVSGACIAAARLREDNGLESEWLHSDLAPGPKTKIVRSPRDYAVTLHVEFTGTNNRATIRAKLVKPNGSTFGDDYAYDVAGPRGDGKRATIFVQTLNQ